MGYIDKLNKRISDKLGDYFSGEEQKIVSLSQISELYKETLETRTYRCIIQDKNRKKKRIFIKYFSPSKIKKIGGLDKFFLYTKHSKSLSIPKIIDVYEDLNSIIFEEVKGEPLSKLVPIYMLPHNRSKKMQELLHIVDKIAKYSARLHNMSYNKSNKTSVCFNDLKLGNVFYDGNEVKIIDFEMIRQDRLNDVASFLVSLDMTQKFPHITKSDVEVLKESFLNTYRRMARPKIEGKNLDVKIDEMKKTVLEVLTKKEYRRGLGIIEILIVEWNAIVLRKMMN